MQVTLSQPCSQMPVVVLPMHNAVATGTSTADHSMIPLAGDIALQLAAHHRPAPRRRQQLGELRRGRGRQRGCVEDPQQSSFAEPVRCACVLVLLKI